MLPLDSKKMVIIQNRSEHSIGYHIVKRISKKEQLTYNKMKRRLEAMVAKDGRFQTGYKFHAIPNKKRRQF